MHDEREDDLTIGAELDAFATRLGHVVRPTTSDDAAFAARVMAAVREDVARHGPPAVSKVADAPRRPLTPVAGGLPRTSRPAGWNRLSQPRSMQLSPLAGLAIAAGFTGIVAMGAWTLGARSGNEAARIATPGITAPSVATRTDTVRLVQFVLVAPEASTVTVAGDFNDWNPAATPLQPVRAGGLWMVSLPLSPGRYEYAFIVDGKSWIADPGAPTAVESDFGQASSVVTVGEVRS